MQSVIAYTVCTASHLGQAKTMADSLAKHNPSYEIIIGLLDKLDKRIDAEAFKPYRLLPVEELAIPEFADMCVKYSLMELSCALKSFYASYLLEKESPDMLVYVDTDIMVFDSFQYAEEKIQDYSIILSPHITSPYPADNKRPQENTITNVGNYNGGFFVLRNDGNARAFLRWWENHMKDKCFDRPADGLFVDQVWFNYVPIFFPGVFIIDHDGYNIAYWNIHERDIEKVNGRFVVNKKFPLVFLHFSGYSFKHPDQIARHQDRFEMAELPCYRELFQQIQNGLIENKHESFLTIQSSYARPTGFKAFLKKVGL